MQTIPESDWKQLAKLKEAALERFCQRVLSEICEIARMSGAVSTNDMGRSYKTIHDRDKELASMFDGLSRSSTAQIRDHAAAGLITDEEFARFSDEGAPYVQKVLAR